ncbi:unnamed protein product [Staurois parvus]|uniref:Uncharacterized protein n=1 Tax=Staurois parvus TaxID=386267 RepID=A0ABN9H0I8_9NEOB|nr:unnamed protein product [Staurois parvus]
MGPYIPPPHVLPGPNLPLGPYIPPPHAAARSRVSHVSLYGLPLLLSPSPHSCHVPLSGLLTLLLGSFCHSCCMASHCCCPPPPHCGSKHWFWPRDWPNE